MRSGQPKVLDFGVAHVTAADLLTTASRTQTGQLLGTLSYMSPEQIAADPAGLDGRSDVYTLGVILFELLAHRLPYHLEQLPVHEVARVIRAAGTIAAGLDRHDLPRRRRDHRGQGDSRKTRARRYATAGDLASDIRRYFRGEAILARPASALYQLRKFARRNKALVAGASGMFAAILVGTVVSIVFALRAENARVADENARVADENARLASERSVPQPIRAIALASRPRLPHFRITTSSMPPASSTRPRRLCAAGNGGILAHPARRQHFRDPGHRRRISVPDPRSEGQSGSLIMDA